MQNSTAVIASFTGKPAVSNYGFLAPAFFGNTTLSLTHNRVIERTQKIIASRNCEVPITRIDSVEITEDGNPLLLVLGFTTIWFGIGILFFALYFIMKYKFLVIRSGSNVQVVVIPGFGSEPINQAKTFMDSVLNTMEQSEL
jgi:hypothetical protein